MSDIWLAAQWPAPDNIVAGTTLRSDANFDFPAEPQFLNQVHGATVLRMPKSGILAGPPDADAIVAERAGAICAVRTADCLPILFCTDDGRKIAAAHAGWRGLAAGVAENAVSALSAPPERLMAWFGPAISQDAFEVGDEVREAFVSHDAAAEAAFVGNARGRWQADLYLLATQRLRAVGVEAVFGGGLCTHGDPDRFYSYRRDGKTGRLVSFIYRAS